MEIIEKDIGTGETGGFLMGGLFERVSGRKTVV
jgi:hypothetical protein